MNRYKVFFIFSFLLTSCATIYKNEHQHYLGIKSAMAKDRYSLAVQEIIIFKEKYPKSNYLCELLPIEIAWRKDRGYETKSDENDFFERCKK